MAYNFQVPLILLVCRLIVYYGYFTIATIGNSSIGRLITELYFSNVRVTLGRDRKYFASINILGYNIDSLLRGEHESYAWFQVYNGYRRW